MQGVLVLLVLIIIYIGALTFWHCPNMKLTDKNKKDILEKGLIHITSKEKAQEILETGKFKCKESSFEKSIGKISWFYIASIREDDYVKMKIVQSKTGKVHYDKMLLVMNISEKDMKNMRIRSWFGRDNAVVYIGEYFKPNNIKEVESN